MLKVEIWAKDKNPVFAFMAIAYATIARDRCDMIGNIKERRINSHTFPLPDFPSWFAMYRSRRPLLAYKRLATSISQLTEQMIFALGGFRKVNKLIEQDPEQFVEMLRTFTPEMLKEGNEDWQKMCSDLFADMKEDISGERASPEQQEIFDIALVKDELPLSFYFLVYAPCILFHETSPNALYRKASQGDKDAIEKLLRIDPLILHDPAIGFQIQKVRLHGKTNEYELLIQSIPKKPGINYKDIAAERKSVKIDFGAQLYVLAQALKLPIKVTDIRRLYDDLAFDYSGELIVKDIKSPAGFDKSIKKKLPGK